MSEKDTISMQLVREALLQTSTDKIADHALLARAGIDAKQLGQAEARVPAQAYARLWRLLERRCNDEFFAMDARGLRRGSLAFVCRASPSSSFSPVKVGESSALRTSGLTVSCSSS